jgi:hypothetical protein
MTDTDKDRIAALEREVAALKEAGKPPAPFKETPYQRWDPTANMSMPLSTMLEMHRAAGHVMGGVLRDNRAPTGRPGMIPDSQQASNARTGNVPGSGTGWAREIPLSNPPSVAQADKLMDEQDRRDRAELAQRLGALKR